MRPRSTLLAFLLLGAPALDGQVVIDYITSVTGTSNLLGYWRFSPTAQANSQVNGYTGTFHGNAAIGAAGTGPTLAIDTANTPLTLDGTNSYVTTSLVGGITSAGTILAWVKLAALPSTTGHYFQIAAQSQVGNDFDLQVQTDNKLYFYTDSGGSAVDPTPLTTNTWVFVAATFTANSSRAIYVNGSLVATSAAGAHSASPNPFTIGENYVFTGRYFDGAIDEVAVFDRALSATEISQIYNSALAIPEPSTLSLLLAGGATLGLARRRARRRAAA